MASPHIRINRKLTRFDLDKRVRILHDDNGVVSILHGRTCDISEGGLCALISGSLRSGAPVRVEISGLEEGSLMLHATVRHAKGFYYGFEFIHIDHKQFATLVRMITRNATPKKHPAYADSPAQA